MSMLPDVVGLLTQYATDKEMRKRRIRVFYGDMDTGRVAPRDNEVIGYVRIYQDNPSMPVQFMFLNNAGAKRGVPIRDNILKIVEVHGGALKHYVAYQHPKYTDPVTEVRWNDTKNKWEVWYNGRALKVFDADREEKAEKYADFLAGRRHNR